MEKAIALSTPGKSLIFPTPGRLVYLGKPGLAHKLGIDLVVGSVQCAKSTSQFLARYTPVIALLTDSIFCHVAAGRLSATTPSTRRHGDSFIALSRPAQKGEPRSLPQRVRSWPP